jgi:exonuclease VII small subunit
MIRLWRVALVLCFALHVSSSSAQDDPKLAASARTLFEEGVQLSDHGQWEGAADRFRRALALRDSQVIRFNLAAALLEQGKVVEASELFRAVVRAPDVEPPLRAEAEQRLTQASQRIAKLTLQVNGTPDGTRVELDGRALPDALIGVATPVDPGKHAARLLSGEDELDAQEAELEAGANATLTLQARRAPSPEQTAAIAVGAEAGSPGVIPPGQATRRDDASARERRKKALWWGIGGGAVVVAGAIIAGVLLANSAKEPSPYRGDFEPGSINVQVSSP